MHSLRSPSSLPGSGARHHDRFAREAVLAGLPLVTAALSIERLFLPSLLGSGPECAAPIALHTLPQKASRSLYDTTIPRWRCVAFAQDHRVSDSSIAPAGGRVRGVRPNTSRRLFYDIFEWSWVNQVVVDQSLVTSRKPDDIPACNRGMIELCSQAHVHAQHTV
jgi:hypothetical protein